MTIDCAVILNIQGTIFRNTARHKIQRIQRRLNYRYSRDVNLHYPPFKSSDIFGIKIIELASILRKAFWFEKEYQQQQ